MEEIEIDINLGPEKRVELAIKCVDLTNWFKVMVDESKGSQSSQVINKSVMILRVLVKALIANIDKDIFNTRLKACPGRVYSAENMFIIYREIVKDVPQIYVAEAFSWITEMDELKIKSN